MGDFDLTPEAEDQLYSIWATIAVDSESAADRVFARIMRKIALASDTPLMGAPRPDIGPDARILIEGRYIVIYEPRSDGLVVVAVVHAMRDRTKPTTP